MAAVAFIVCRTASIKNSARIVRPRRERAHLRDSPLVLRRAAVPHDLGNRVDRPPAGHRIAIPGALPFNQIMRCRIVTAQVGSVVKRPGCLRSGALVRWSRSEAYSSPAFGPSTEPNG